MELELIRSYFPAGVNGEILLNGKRVCSSIELPWKNNQHRISCIPEGRYALTKRYSQRFGDHLLLNDVADRSYILIHAYNDALKESKGCIAPVSICTGQGKGNNSRVALKRILAMVYPELTKGNKVYLTIKSKSHE